MRGYWVVCGMGEKERRKEDSEVESQSNRKDGTPALDGLFWPCCAPEKYEFYVNSLS